MQTLDEKRRPWGRRSETARTHSSRPSLQSASTEALIVIEQRAGAAPTVRSVSEQAAALLGTPVEELTARPLAALKHVSAPDRIALEDAFRRAALSGSPVAQACRYYHGTGGVKRLAVYGTCVSVGELRTWMVLLRDRSREFAVRDALRTTRLQLESALDAGSMAPLTWYPDSDALVLPVEACRLLRQHPATRATTMGTFLSAISSSDRALLAHELERLRSGATRSLHTVFALPDEQGGTQWVSLAGRVEQARPKHARRLLGVVADVTRFRQREAQQVQTQQLSLVGSFASGIAHDFKNVLAAARGHMELGLRADNLDDARSALQGIAEVVRSGERLVRRILDLGRPAVPEAELSDVNAAVQEAVGLIRPSVPPRVALRTQLDGCTPRVLASATELHQVVLNLLGNAVHALEASEQEQPEVLVQVQSVDAAGVLRVGSATLPPGRYALIAVRDNGPGMDESTRARIFEPYFTTKPKHQGTGLGLAVVRGIVRRLHGHLSVHSAPGQGATFRVYLPEVEPATDAARAELDAEPASYESAADAARISGVTQKLVLGRRRVLCVDDDFAVGSFVRSAAELAGLDACLVGSVSAAVAELRRTDSRPYDLVISDWNLAESDARPLLEVASQLGRALPVLLLSGLDAPPVGVVPALARRWLEKPLALDDLLHVMRELLSDEPSSRG